MTGRESGGGRTPGDGDGDCGGDGTESVPDEVWQRFLADSESAIRRSAPREPSAHERTVLAHGVVRDPEGATGAVGELWQPEERWGGPAWRDMDSRARRRRVGRALGTVAALALLLGALSQLPASSRNPYQGPTATVSQQSEEAPESVPSTTATVLPRAAFAPDGT